MSSQLELRDQPSIRGRKLCADHPWGMPEATWWLARKYMRRGCPAPDARRLAILYPSRETRARLCEAPATVWDPPTRMEQEPQEKTQNPDRIRVLFRLDCSSIIRKRIQAGEYPGIEWVDGLGGVLEASRRTRKT